MANRAGLRKVTKTVRGKKGSVRRSYWVKASGAVKGAAKAAGGFVARHKGKIAGAAALAGAAYLGVRHGSKIAGAVHGLNSARKYISAHKAASGESLGLRTMASLAKVGAKVGARNGAAADNARMNRIGDRAALTGVRASRAASSVATSVANAGKRAAGHARTGVRHAAGRAARLAGG